MASIAGFRRVPEAGHGSPRWLLVVILSNVAYWVGDGIHEWRVRGLFVIVGVDWARFWAATRALVHVNAPAAYKLPDIAAFMEPLVRYYRPGVGQVRVGPAPYPPGFLRLFELFTLPPPLVGFLLWTALNTALAGLVVWRLAGRFGSGSRAQIALVMLCCFPLMMALFVGQVVVLLLVCLMLAMDDLERGRDLRAGIWTGLLVFKPQYAFVLMLVYLLKRRYAAIVGCAVGAGAILGGSLVGGGIDGTLAYARMLVTEYPAYAGGLAIDPRGMVGWRSLVLTLLPGLGDTWSLVLVAVLSLLTLAVLVPVWHGPWCPGSPRFARQMTATMTATLLVAYHSQPHGMALLLVPCAALLASGMAPAGVRPLLIGAIAAAPVVGLVSALVRGDLHLVSLMFSLVLLALLALVVRHDVPLRWPSLPALTPDRRPLRRRSRVGISEG